MSLRSRRRFLRTALGGAMLLPGVLRSQSPEGISPRATSADSLIKPRLPHPLPPRPERKDHEEEAKPELLKPHALTLGATIGLVAPASGVTRSELNSAVASLRKLGFEVKVGEHLTKDFGYLAGTDQERAEEFMAFVRDPDVACIMAVRGGYGVMRILPMLDFDEIRASRKIILGYSDITALVNAIYQKSGLIAFHGPVATSTFDHYTVQSFERTLMYTQPAGTFAESDEFEGMIFGEARASTLVPGRAQGRLVGGNLSLVTAVMGTPYEVDTTDAILFLEEIDEEPYHIDRMLTQLALGGKLSACAGVALGRFKGCEARGRGGEFRVSLSLEQVLRGILEPLGIPTVYGLSIGHIKSKLTVPVGGLATLDADEKLVSIDEATVV